MKNFFSIVIIILFTFIGLFAENQINTIQRSESKISFSFDNSKKENYLIVARPESTMPVKPVSRIRFKSANNFNAKDSLSSTGKNNIIVYYGADKKISASIEGLLPESSYCFDFYKLKSGKKSFPGMINLSFTQNIKTLAISPKKQATNIVFANSDSSHEIALMWKRGDGKRCFVLCNESESPDYPKDGFEYKANANFTNSESQITGTKTFVVFESKTKNDNKTFVKNLKEATDYYFAIVEANGDGESIRYLAPENLTKLNPRKKTTNINPPVALDVIEMSDTTFTAHWTLVPLAVTYELDVSQDESFQNYFRQYKNLDVGNFQDMPVADCKTGTKYYYRVRAITSKGKTGYLNTIPVTTK